MSEPMSGNTPPASEPNNEKIMAILAYIIFFIPMITGDWNKSTFVRYHTNQGFVLFLFSVVGTVVLAIIPVVGWILLTVFPIVVLVFIILGIVTANKMETRPLPIIGGITLIK